MTRRSVGGVLADYPSVATAGIICFVMLHSLLAIWVPQVSVASALARTRSPDPITVLSALALGVAGVSALVGGFAGVVVVFGLGSEGDRFRRLRTQGDDRLRANWISVVLSSFAGAFGSLLAAVIVIGYDRAVGMWVLEACVLFAVHGAIRLTALLGGLARVVANVDAEISAEEEAAVAEAALPKLRGVS